MPPSPDLEIAAGSEQLWRILNAATDAFLDLAIVDEDGIPLPLEVVARDGAPLTDDAGRPLSPRARRLNRNWCRRRAGSNFWSRRRRRQSKAYLVTHAVDTGCAGDRVPERRLAVIAASPAATAPIAACGRRRTSAGADLFDGLMSRKTDRAAGHRAGRIPASRSDDQTDFYIVERKPGAVLKPFEMGDPPAITVQAGTTEEWVIENWTNELHAFHIHQVHFRLLEIDGKKVADPPLLDVVNVPYATATGYHSKEGPVRPGRVRIKLTFPEALAGDIPFHCHLVDHEDNGMMAVLRVVPPPRTLAK